MDAPATRQIEGNKNMHVIVGTFGQAKAKSRARNNNYVYWDLLSGYIVRGSSEICISSQAKCKRQLMLLLFTRTFASYDMIWEALWGDDDDGGPSCVRNNLFVHILRLNQRLKQLKLRIIYRHGQGFELVEL